MPTRMTSPALRVTWTGSSVADIVSGASQKGQKSKSSSSGAEQTGQTGPWKSMISSGLSSSGMVDYPPSSGIASIDELRSTH